MSRRRATLFFGTRPGRRTLSSAPNLGMLALLLIGPLLAGEVPVLLDPVGARSEAARAADEVAPDRLLGVAEEQLLAGASAEALATLERLELEIETPEGRARRLRIALDAEVARRNPARARPLAEALFEI